MTFSSVSSETNVFNAKFHVNVTAEWFSSALKSCKSHQNIFQQFLNTCISKTSCSVLPESIRSQHAVNLVNLSSKSTSLTLQVYDIVDIGMSMYSQVDQANSFSRQIQVEDAARDEDSPALQSFRIRETGVYKLELWDGKYKIPAFVYYPVKQLSVKTCPPGTKIRLTGATIRRGGVVLTAETCQVLGGVVPELEHWSYQSALRRKLNMEDSQNQTTPVQSQPQSSQQPISTNFSDNDGLDDDDWGDDFDYEQLEENARAVIRQQQQGQQQKR